MADLIWKRVQDIPAGTMFFDCEGDVHGPYGPGESRSTLRWMNAYGPFRPVSDVREWCRITGVRVEGDHAFLYKATGPDGVTGRDYYQPTTYRVGEVVTAPDWRDDNQIGYGLHVSPSILQAHVYVRTPKSRFFAVRAALEDVRVLSYDKCKVPKLFVVSEVDRHDGQ